MLRANSGCGVLFCTGLKPTCLLWLLTIVFSVPQGTREKRENRFPVLNLMGPNQEKIDEAQAWIQRILTLQDYHIIEDMHILYLGKKKHDYLSQLQKTSWVSISEMISPGKAHLEIKGAQAEVGKCRRL